MSFNEVFFEEHLKFVGRKYSTKYKVDTNGNVFHQSAYITSKSGEIVYRWQTTLQVGENGLIRQMTIDTMYPALKELYLKALGPQHPAEVF